LQVLEKCNERITNIVTHLREFSRQTDLEMKRIDINEPLSNALLISTQQLMNMEITVQQDLAADLPQVHADANLMEQVFLDLIANARDAMEAQPPRRLQIRSRLDPDPKQPMVVVEFQDSGSGIPPGIQDKIFEPFFTTKPLGQGTGLGLPICYGIIEKHEGHLTFESDEKTGTIFRIRLPAVREQTAAAEHEEQQNEPQDTAD
jgi:signal transduction histidine kinase